MKYDVFLSYAREDSERARWFIDLFEGRGWNVFWDTGSYRCSWRRWRGRSARRGWRR